MTRKEERMTRQQDRALWAQARTLEDLGYLMAESLAGELLWAPGGYEDGPDPETTPILNELVWANRHGFLTTDSQPGFTNRPAYDGRPCAQRAAVQGFMNPGRALNRLIDKATKRGLRVFVYPRGTPEWKSDNMTVTVWDGEPYTWFGHHVDPANLRVQWEGIGLEAFRSLTLATQLTIVDKRYGDHPDLWRLIGSL